MTIIKHVAETGKFPNNNLFLFYGKPKSGKSSFVATWNNALVFDLESGYNNISADIITPKTHQEFLKELHNPKNLKPYDNIIIDTIDIVYEWVERSTIDALNRSFKTSYNSISEFSHGSGWASARMGLKKFIMGDLFDIKRMNKNVILVAHEKSITITRNGKEENAFTLSLPGQTASMVESLADACGRVYSRNIAGRPEQRVNFVPSLDSGGSRIKSLAAKDIPLDFQVLKNVIESNKPAKKPKKLTEITPDKSEEDEDEW